MSQMFPLCNYTEDNPFVCLSCPYPIKCPYELLDERKEIMLKKQKQKEHERLKEEERKINEELLNIRWEQYKRFHPHGLSEEAYKASQRAKDAYQKEWRERKRVEKNGVS